MNDIEQIDMFEVMYDELPKVNKLKVGTFFSGIGSPEKALGNIGIDYDLQFFSEIDKYAIKAYCAIHDESESKCVGSISELKGINLPYCDLWFGGFPCQDISTAGKSRGFNIESESRSSLGWEMIRLLREVEEKPKYIVFENVAAITNEQHRPTLNMFKRDLEDLGYTLFNDLLNSKNYGIPQSRNRYFLIAILGKYSYKFPTTIKLELRFKDMLENEVEDKYYLSEKAIAKIYRGDSGKFISKDKETCGTIISSYYKIPRDGIYIEDLKGKRRLSTLEVYRLMGFSDTDYELAAKVVSNTQLYKTAGNSIVVNVLEHIFINLLGGNYGKKISRNMDTI